MRPATSGPTGATISPSVTVPVVAAESAAVRSVGRIAPTASPAALAVGIGTGPCEGFGLGPCVGFGPGPPPGLGFGLGSGVGLGLPFPFPFPFALPFEFPLLDCVTTGRGRGRNAPQTGPPHELWPQKNAVRVPYLPPAPTPLAARCCQSRTSTSHARGPSSAGTTFTQPFVYRRPGRSTSWLPPGCVPSMNHSWTVPRVANVGAPPE